MSIQQIMLASSEFKASGGTITDVGSYRYHTFTSGGDFTVISGSKKCDYLIIGGGGSGTGTVSGSGGIGGGGGGGDYVETRDEFISVGIYPVVVAGVAIGPSNGSINGYNSSFNGKTAIGGGGGDSKPGASGGGSRGQNPAVYNAGGAATGINGFAGGNHLATGWAAGGGGGAGGVGGNNSGNTGGIGGVGIANADWLGGNPVCVGGGGASESGSGGSGRGYGGNGASGSGGGGGSAVYYGCGGGGARNNSGFGGAGGNGGAGIVIIRYLK